MGVRAMPPFIDGNGQTVRELHLDRYVKAYRDDIRDAVQRNDARVTA